MISRQSLGGFCGSDGPCLATNTCQWWQYMPHVTRPPARPSLLEHLRMQCCSRSSSTATWLWPGTLIVSWNNETCSRPWASLQPPPADCWEPRTCSWCARQRPFRMPGAPCTQPSATTLITQPGSTHQQAGLMQCGCPRTCLTLAGSPRCNTSMMLLSATMQRCSWSCNSRTLPPWGRGGGSSLMTC